MPYRKTMKVNISATRLNLDRLPCLHFNYTKNDTVGVATLKASGKKLSKAQLERAGDFVVDYLERRTGTIEYADERSGPFVFSLKNKIDLLDFIRDFRKEHMCHGECDYVKVDIKFQ